MLSLIVVDGCSGEVAGMRRGITQETCYYVFRENRWAPGARSALGCQVRWRHKVPRDSSLQALLAARCLADLSWNLYTFSLQDNIHIQPPASSFNTSSSPKWRYTIPWISWRHPYSLQILLNFSRPLQNQHQLSLSRPICPSLRLQTPSISPKTHQPGTLQSPALLQNFIISVSFTSRGLRKTVESGIIW